MKDLTKIYIDLSKCSEEQRKSLPQILEKAGEKRCENCKIIEYDSGFCVDNDIDMDIRH